MKRIIIIRSLRVAIVLAILCASIYLTFYRHYLFILLILLCMLLLDFSDSTLVYRLKRIEDSRVRTSFIYTYLVTTVVGIVSGTYALVSTVESRMQETSIKLNDIDALNFATEVRLDNPFNLFWFMFSILIVILSFRYYIIVMRVMVPDEEY